MKAKTVGKWVAAGVALLASSWGTAASAALVDTVNNFGPGSSYENTVILSPGQVFNDEYVFNTSGASSATTSYFEFDSIPVSGNWGIDNFTVTWLDDASNVITSVQVTDGTGAFLTTTPFSISMLADSVYHLFVSGTAWSPTASVTGGGAYHVAVSASAVPLPPAVLLFGSLLAGGAALGRRKKKQSNGSAVVAA